jgi:NAD(P)-dependent dehydrogenase (short-subunit alcohol dehydrogenase family)
MAKGHQDKIAVITGGANGIGQAFAQRLAQDGVHVAVADRQAGDETVRLVQEAGREGVAFDCDVSSPEQVKQLAANVQQRFGRCDILVNCAGVATMEEEFQRTANMQAIKRPEVPADLVGTISFLTSDDAAFITGQMINVDGGRNRS